MPARSTFVIVGAGLAGAKAAETLRDEGFDGRIVLVGEEDAPPYERPPLSKTYLQGDSQRGDAQVHPEGFYSERAIELRSATAATAVDLATREVVLAGDERLGFDRLLIATGAAPRRLGVPGAELDGVLYLRELADADAIRERAAHGARALVVGAGWIGCEVAASLRSAGAEVTVVEPARLPLERVLGPELGAVYRDVHSDHGVRFLLGTGVQALEGGDRVERALTTDGRRVECDLVVVGIGVELRTEVAAAAGLEVGPRGIPVDAEMRTSAPDVFAAGDVTDAWHPLFGESLHVEHWANALHQGPAAARAMLGRGEPYVRVPYFYSDQYDVGMEYAGHAARWDRVVFRGDPASREFIAFWLDGERVAAGMNVNVWDVNEAIQDLVRGRALVDARQLVDHDVPLDALTRRAPARSA